jgi:hypothetical protein
LIVASAAGAALALSAGCSGSGAGIAPAVYAQRVCSSVATFEAALSASARSLSATVADASADPAKIKKGAADLLAQAERDSSTLAAALAQADFPRGDHGKQVAMRLAAAADQAHQILHQQAQALAAAPITSRDAFTALLAQVGQQVESGGNALVDGLNAVGDIGNLALNRAFAADQSCRGL